MSRACVLGLLVLLGGLSDQGYGQNCAPPFNPCLFFEPTFPATCEGNAEEWPCTPIQARDPFLAGNWNGQFSAGYERRVGGTGPTFEFLPVAGRLGYIVNTPEGESFLRGACELIFEFDFSAVTQEFGSHLTGPSLLARYNFVQPECNVIPFVQLGAGLAFTDAHRENQPLIGDDTLFRLRAEVGARYMITEAVSVDLTAGYCYLTNAVETSRNQGIAAMGASLGFTYFFGRP